MTLSIVIIGDEILLGRVADTNSGFIARYFEARGAEVKAFRTVGDDAAQIKEAIENALSEADTVITTGGLGPTRDDITKGVLASVFGGEPVLHEPSLQNVERIFKSKGLVMNDLTRAQAMVPSSAEIIVNHLGTAPVMVFRRGSKTLVTLPGVPTEAEGLVTDAVGPMLCGQYGGKNPFRRFEITVTGISESALAEQLAKFEDSLPAGSHLAYLPTRARITLRLDMEDLAPQVAEECENRLTALCGSNFRGLGVLTPADLVLDGCRRLGLSLGCAESCTGGRVAAAVTAIPGCSDIFSGGVVAYANSVKENVLGVSAQTIRDYGAVSEEVVAQMADGAAKLLGADCAVATSGVAGPGGGTPEKPVGTVWIAARTPRGNTAQLLHLSGSRERIAQAAADRALLLLDSLLQKHYQNA